jgi:predicted deacylase
MAATTRVWTPIDFMADGRQEDCFRVPHSTNLSAYGWIPVPLVCLKNGRGPTALLVAGSHGDEYEGQVALMKLAREIGLSEVAGRIIILPALNFPAVDAGGRVSPIDQGNLNRLFPGDPHGTPTEMIAHYVSETLIPMADLVVDLHSGGRSLHYVPSALVRPGRTVGEHRVLLQLMEIFGAPVSFVSNGAGGGGVTTLAAAAQARNVPALTTELGGSASLSRSGLDLAEAGLRRLLKHLGIVPDMAVKPARPTRLMEVVGRASFVYARSRGIFEPAAGVGDEIAAGDIAGYIHHFEWPARGPDTLLFDRSGLVACQRAPSLTQPGDCLFKIVEDVRSRTPHALTLSDIPLLHDPVTIPAAPPVGSATAGPATAS